MRSRSLISFIIITMLVGLGSLVLSTAQVRAQQQLLCDIIIEKQADPADNTEFNFSVTGATNFDFKLMDDATRKITIKVGEIVTVLEEVPPGWILDENIVCQPSFLDITIATNGLRFDCIVEDEVTCTFFNVRVATNVPTLSEWGLIAMAAVLGIVGFMVIRRRKVSA